MPNLSFLKNQPTKIICVGLNYHCHAKELGMATPHHPIICQEPSIIDGWHDCSIADLI